MKIFCRYGIAILALLCCVQATPSPAQTLNENAALYYWEALARMRQPSAARDFEILDFISRDMPLLSPAILSANTDAAEWLMSDRAMVSALAKAGRCSRCTFIVRTPSDPFPPLEHLIPMRVLTDRALAVAKAYEFGRNSEGAATIYRDLLILVRNLDKDGSIRSGLLAADILQQILEDVEGFLSREPDRAASALLSDYFLQSTRPVFHPGDYLRAESLSFRQWMLQDPAQMEQKLLKMYGGEARSEAVIQLLSLEIPKKVLRMGNWIMDYEAWMLRLAKECEEPYQGGIGALRWSDSEKTRMVKEQAGPDGNPLFAFAIPPMAEAYERFLAAEGQFSMAAIMSTALLYLQDYGRWPVSLSEISVAAKGPLPTDPFAGEDFFYKTSRLLPRIMMRIPKSLMDHGKVMFRMDIKARRENDDRIFKQALKDFEKKWRNEAMRAAQKTLADQESADKEKSEKK